MGRRSYAVGSLIPEAQGAPPLFRSFWMGGFEGADHRNGHGVALDINRLNRHDVRFEEDYAALRPFGIRTIRESVGWRRSTSARGRPDLAGLRRIAKGARDAGLQVVWTIQHYGVPDDVDLFDASYPSRFAAFCDAVSRVLRSSDDGATIYQPINEISFLAWAASSTGLFHPHHGDRRERAHELKRNLVRAAIAGCDAIWSNDPSARIVHTDPIIHVVDDAAEGQYEAWDMLAGRRDADLGGSPRYLDIVGANYYHDNQWRLEGNEPLHWHLKDERRAPLDVLIERLSLRYGRPTLLSETGHVGAGRVAWLDEIGDAVMRCRARGVPMEGVCLYPLIDRPDWQDPTRWHDSGLWDVTRARGAPLTDGRRVLHEPYAARLRTWQALLARPDDVHSTREDGASVPASASIPSDPAPSSSEVHVPPLIVFSHLRWDFVYQRPQQLLSRMAQRFPVVFVEEPMPGAARTMLEVMHPCAGVEVLRPHLTGTAPGFHDDHIPQLRELLATNLLDRSIDAYWLWFYTPMALPLAAELAPVGIVYDCMDELAAFRNAPRQLIQRENALLKLADLVFTGGPSLHASKRDRHANAHCFPSSVDAEHYARPARATEDRTLDHPAQSGIAHPRLGYFGVIDERIDLDLIAALADAHADWQIVMVGPLAKIDPASAPRRANIHWLGQRAYADLPDLVAGWDVCLLPFALNDSTRFISPTKTLEYLAADRPAVSTPIADVAGPYADVVAIAATHADFVAACEATLARTASDREADSRVRAEVVRSSSWDRTVDAMATLMQAVTVTRDECDERARMPAALALGVGHASHGDVVEAKTLILGGGPTGLAAALRAGVDSVLLEKNPTVGGWCRSIEDGGFTFDHAGHIMFSTDPYVLDLYERLLGDNLHWQNREAWVYSQGVHTRYPFQAALYGLPAPVLQECLVGAIEARFGPIGKPASKLSPTGPSRAATTTPEVAHEDGGRKVAALTPIVPRNFEEFIHTVWGAGVAKHFALPYNRKLWGLPLTEMETSWLGGRVPLPDLEEMIAGALAPIAKPLGPNARFGYPLRGGFQALMDGFLPLLEGTIETGATIVAVSPAARTVTLDDGRAYRYESLISTLPLPRLIEMIGAEAPPAVREAVAGLRHVSVRCVNLGIGREHLTDKHWIYYPEDTVFHRVFVQGNTSPHCNATGGFGLTCEITYSSEKELIDDGEALTRRCIDDCIRVGLFTKDDPVWVANQVDMPYAYVVYDHTRAARVATIRDWLLARDIVLAGRYSEWEYYNSDHAFVAGRNAAETAIGLHGSATTDEELAVSA